jgi:hypothetical protein
MTAARTIASSSPARVLAAALTLTLAFAAPARASEVTKIFEACSNGALPTGYSQRAYSQAIKQMPAELAEYTDCPDLIDKAELAAASARGGQGASAGQAAETSAAAVAPPTPSEQRTLEGIPHAAAPSVPVGGQVIRPGVVHVNLASALRTLPTPLLVLLACLLACATLGLAWWTRRRVGRLRAGSDGDPATRE